MDDIKKDHTKVASTCQELQRKCINQEAEINHLKSQLATLKWEDIIITMVTVLLEYIDQVEYGRTHVRYNVIVQSALLPSKESNVNSTTSRPAAREWLSSTPNSNKQPKI